MIKPIEQQWDIFAALVLPADAPPIQRRETRRAFYAGAAALQKAVFKGLSSDEGVSEKDVEFMTAIDNELYEFGQSIGTGGR